MEAHSPIRVSQWIIIGIGVTLLILWGWFGQLCLMAAPIHLRQGLYVLGSTLLLLCVMLAVVAVIQSYERALRDLNTQIHEKNAALERLDATRDKRLLDVARDLSHILIDLTLNTQFVLQSIRDLPNIKSLAAALDRAERISAISKDLLNLSEMEPEPPSRDTDLRMAA